MAQFVSQPTAKRRVKLVYRLLVHLYGKTRADALVTAANGVSKLDSLPELDRHDVLRAESMFRQRA